MLILAVSMLLLKISVLIFNVLVVILNAFLLILNILCLFWMLQLVTAEMQEIGCAYKYCDPLIDTTGAVLQGINYMFTCYFSPV